MPMVLSVGFLLVAAASSFFPPNVLGISTGSTPPIVDLGYAKYAGTFNATTDITQFLGIRYAAPPTGMFSFLF